MFNGYLYNILEIIFGLITGSNRCSFTAHKQTTMQPVRNPKVLGNLYCMASRKPRGFSKGNIKE